MTASTIPELVFDTEPRDTAAVISPAYSNSALSRDELSEASAKAADDILALLKPESPGIDGQPVVSMALPNGLGFVLAFLGVVAKGAIAAPLNPAYTVPEYEVSTFTTYSITTLNLLPPHRRALAWTFWLVALVKLEGIADFCGSSISATPRPASWS